MPDTSGAKSTAAFFLVEGTLVKRGVLATAAYIAANGQGIGERLFRLGGVALAAPIYGLLGQTDRNTANRAAWLCCRYMSEDRIATVGEEFFEEILKDQVLDRGLDLIERAREDGHRIVLLSENINFVIERLADFIGGVDHMVTNRLEFDGLNGLECTGRLLDPIIGGASTRKWIQQFAAANENDQDRSVAYAAHGPDLLMLATVGRPCAVNPDFTLRKAAKEADWPVVEYTV